MDEWTFRPPPAGSARPKGQECIAAECMQFARQDSSWDNLSQSALHAGDDAAASRVPPVTRRGERRPAAGRHRKQTPHRSSPPPAGAGQAAFASRVKRA